VALGRVRTGAETVLWGPPGPLTLELTASPVLDAPGARWTREVTAVLGDEAVVSFP
jgi:hypothetical protein